MDEYHPVLWFLSIDEKKILEEKNIVGNFVFSGFLLEMKIVEGEESKNSNVVKNCKVEGKENGVG